MTRMSNNISYNDLQTSASQLFDNIKDASSHLIRGVKNFFYDISNHVITYEHHGSVLGINPIYPTPEEYNGKCYHVVKLTDGSQFNLIFDHVNFNDIREKVKPGKILRLVYKMPDFQIVNLYPLPYFKNSTYGDFLDETDIPDNIPIRVSYFDGEIKKVEFLEMTRNQIDHSEYEYDYDNNSDEMDSIKSRDESDNLI